MSQRLDNLIFGPSNVPDWSRTSGLSLRRRTLYPAELQRRIQFTYKYRLFENKCQVELIILEKGLDLEAKYPL